MQTLLTRLRSVQPSAIEIMHFLHISDVCSVSHITI